MLQGNDILARYRRLDEEIATQIRSYGQMHDTAKHQEAFNCLAAYRILRNYETELMANDVMSSTEADLERQMNTLNVRSVDIYMIISSFQKSIYFLNANIFTVTLINCSAKYLPFYLNQNQSHLYSIFL